MPYPDSIQRQQKLAELLRQQADMPVQSQRGATGMAVPNAAGHIDRLAAILTAPKAQQQADLDAAQYNQGRQQKLAQMLKGSGMESLAEFADTPEMQQAIMSGYVGSKFKAPKSPEIKTVKEMVNGSPVESTYKMDESGNMELLNPNAQVPIKDPTSTDPYLDSRLALIEAQTNAANARADKTETVKPLSPSLQKLQDDRLQEISDLYNRATPLSESLANLDAGKLKLNAVSNVINQGVGAIGMGGEEADSLAQFKSALEGLAVDQSNLAKGVQTDKDFERSRRSILENINNESYVKAELPKLIALNNKRRKDRQSLINKMRRDQGQPEMTAEEFSAYGGDNVIPAIENAAKTPTADKKVLTYNPATGQLE